MGRIYGFDLKACSFFSDIDLVIPVPLHPSKIRLRGFNQSELISEGLAEVSGLRMDTDSLIRITGTETQTKRSRLGRWDNVEGILSVSLSMT